MKKFGIILVILFLLAGTLSSISAAEWPMFQNNPRHTGYVAQDSSYSTQTWTTNLDGSIKANPVLCADKLYVGTDKGTLYELDAQDGNESWTFETKGSIVSSPAVSENTLYVGSEDGYLYRLRSYPL